jgi:SAM-dependent MidA family methyltransferase
MNLYPTQQTHLAAPQKAPKRITVTVPFAILDQLIERSGYEGRSISNLAAFLLEQGLSTRR